MGVSRMRVRLFALAVAALLFAAPSTTAQAANPEEIVLRYFESIQAGDWEEAARYLDPEELAVFKGMMFSLFEAEEGGELLLAVFGEGTTVEDLRDATAGELFARIMDFYSLFLFEPVSAGFDSIQVLGSVPEGEGAVHVVTRMWMHVQGVPVNSVEVITLRRGSSGWFIAFEEELSGMIRVFESVLSGALE